MNNLNFNKLVYKLPFFLLLFLIFLVVYILIFNDRLVFTIVGALIGIWGNRNLEVQRNKRERDKIATDILVAISNEKSNIETLISSIKINDNFIDSFIYNKSLREAFFKLRSEDLYNTVLKELGTFEVDIALELQSYFTEMKLALKLQSDLYESYSNIPNLNKEEIHDVLTETYIQLQIMKITGIKCIFLILKRVFNKDANIKEFKRSLIEDYKEIKSQAASPTLNRAAEKIESIFNLCGELEELRNIT